jgi:single-strand DNA-binding protein
MRNQNITVFTGRLTADPQLKPVNNSHALNFTVVCHNGKNKNDNIDKTYFECVIYDSYALSLQPFLKKGMKVSVKGSIRQNFYTDKEGKRQKPYFILVEYVEFLDDKSFEETDNAK